MPPFIYIAYAHPPAVNENRMPSLSLLNENPVNHWLMANNGCHWLAAVVYDGKLNLNLNDG
jgi:hypothetical protein